MHKRLLICCQFHFSSLNDTLQCTSRLDCIELNVQVLQCVEASAHSCVIATQEWAEASQPSSEVALFTLHSPQSAEHRQSFLSPCISKVLLAYTTHCLFPQLNSSPTTRKVFAGVWEQSSEMDYTWIHSHLMAVSYPPAIRCHTHCEKLCPQLWRVPFFVSFTFKFAYFQKSFKF